jgi:hypothetical protein
MQLAKRLLERTASRLPRTAPLFALLPALLLAASAAHAQDIRYGINPASRYPIQLNGGLQEVYLPGPSLQYDGAWQCLDGIIEGFAVERLPLVSIESVGFVPGDSREVLYTKYFQHHPQADAVFLVGPACPQPPDCGVPAVSMSYTPTADGDFYAYGGCNDDAVPFGINVRNTLGGLVGVKFSGDLTRYGLRVYTSNTFEFYVSGHAFCALIDNGNIVKFGKNTFHYLPLTQGRIIDESTTLWTDYIEWPLTRARYNAALLKYMELKRLSDLGDDIYYVFKQNCVQFAAEIAEAAGVDMPRYKMIVAPWSPDPGVLAASIRWHLAHDGGCQPEGRPRGKCVSPGHFHGGDAGRYIVSAEALISHTLADPDAAAASFLSEATYHDVSIDIAGWDPEHSLLMTDFGDGSAPVFEDSVEHAYAKPGSYHARVIVIGAAGIQVIRMPIAVTAKGKPAYASIDVPALPPLDQPLNPGDPPVVPPFARTFPADPTCDWFANGEDLAMLLAAWGSTAPTIADIDEDGVVSGNDLAIVLAGWGSNGK